MPNQDVIDLANKICAEARAKKLAASPAPKHCCPNGAKHAVELPKLCWACQAEKRGEVD